MIIIIFGPPGSGKGTQSSILVKKYDLELISIGDLLRGIISIQSDLGNKIKDVVQSGNLIQDDIICELLERELLSIDDNFLLDGFPRNLNQARFLTKILNEKRNKDVDYVIELKVKDDIVINRLQNRIVCLDCNNVMSFKNNLCLRCNGTRLEKRADDTDMSAIQRRINEYRFQMNSLSEYYRNKLLTVDASLDITRVAEEIEDKISFNLV